SSAPGAAVRLAATPVGFVPMFRPCGRAGSPGRCRCPGGRSRAAPRSRPARAAPPPGRRAFASVVWPPAPHGTCRPAWCPYPVGGRRGGAGAAATVAAAGRLALGGAVGGCTTTVAGHGAPAAAGLTSPTARSGVPGPGLPSLPLPSGGGADPNPEIPDSPCDVLDKNQLRQQFGQDVDIQSQLDTCKITLSDGSFLAFNAYAALTLDYEKHQEPGRSVTIADRPAYLAQHDHYIVVGRSK